MSDSRAWTPLVALLLSTAGCIGADDGAGDEALDTSATPTDPSAAAGDEPGAVDADAPAATVEAEPAAPVVVTTPIKWDGTTRTSFCAPSGSNSCTGASLSESNSWLEMEAEGAPQSLAAELTWSASTPATSELFFAIAAFTSCGDRCTSFRSLEDASGPSPLVLDESDIVLEEGETGVGIYVSAAMVVYQNPVYGSVSFEQMFSLVGTYVSVVDAASG